MWQGSWRTLEDTGVVQAGDGDNLSHGDEVQKGERSGRRQQGWMRRMREGEGSRVTRDAWVEKLMGDAVY